MPALTEPRSGGPRREQALYTIDRGSAGVGYIIQMEDFEPLIGSEAIARIQAKARKLRNVQVVNFNSTYYGGGVAEMLSSLTLLMNGLGVKTEWRVIQGTPDFFNITKKMHNALQGGDINLTDLKLQIYEGVVHENAVRNHLYHDYVVIHDPQPLPLIEHYQKKNAWIWRCHIELSRPHPGLWNYLAGFVEKYDAAILSCREYTQRLTPPQVFFMPAINPFSIKNRQLSDAEMDERFAHYHIPTDLPLIVQVSRFDPWKDPQGVIEAFKQARREVDATLVLLGNFATDDPEGAAIYEALLRSRDERILVLPYGDDSALVNALQTRAAAVVQKIDPRGLRPDRDRSDVEGHSGDRRECRRHPLSDREWDKRIPGVDYRGDGVTDGPACQGPRAASAHGREGARERARALSPDALFGAVSGPVRLLRGGLPAPPLPGCQPIMLHMIEINARHFTMFLIISPARQRHDRHEQWRSRNVHPDRH